jgi:hypothetical protein
MDPQEEFDRQVWEVLQAIKGETLAQEHREGVVKYEFEETIKKRVVSASRIKNILYTLQTKGALKIHHNEKGDRIGDKMTFYLILDEQNFTELYRFYESKFTNRGDSQRSNKPKKMGTTHIEKIEFVRREQKNNKTKVFVNKDYSLYLEVRLKNSWLKLYQLAEGEDVPFERAVLDYFNSHPDNPLYARLEYKKTKILKSDGEACILPNISLGIITKKKITQRTPRNT